MPALLFAPHVDVSFTMSERALTEGADSGSRKGTDRSLAEPSQPGHQHGGQRWSQPLASEPHARREASARSVIVAAVVLGWAQRAAALYGSLPPTPDLRSVPTAIRHCDAWHLFHLQSASGFMNAVLELPIHRAMRFLLVSPHYPENVGAACRALKAMGFSKLGLVTPNVLAMPSNVMAQKMAVKSLDVLDAAALFDEFADAIVGSDVIVGTTARRGVSNVLPPCGLADTLVSLAAEGKRITMVFGNEKSGLTSEQLAKCDLLVRIPLAADQPSLNLAQAVQIITYELFRSGLAERQRERDAAT